MAKNYCVTGASSGIGRAIAEYLTAQGHHVLGISRRAPEGTYAFQHLCVDITDPHAIDELKTLISASFTPLHGLVNCAGMGISGAIEDTPIEDIHTIFSVNVYGMHRVTQALLPLLRDSKGTIVNVGSVAGTLTIPFQTFYSMTKAAVLSYTEGLRLELQPYGVRVTALLPGDTKTGFTDARQKTAPSSSVYAKRVQQSVERMEHDEQHGMSPRALAVKTAFLLQRKSPPVATTVGLQYHLILVLKKFLPHRLVLRVLYWLYGN